MKNIFEKKKHFQDEKTFAALKTIGIQIEATLFFSGE